MEIEATLLDHCIEHGNLIDDPTAKLLADAGAVMVPTLVTYQAISDIGKQLGLPAANLEKNTVALESGLESLERAHAAGVTMAFGTGSPSIPRLVPVVRATRHRPVRLIRPAATRCPFVDMVHLAELRRQPTARMLTAADQQLRRLSRRTREQ